MKLSFTSIFAVTFFLSMFAQQKPDIVNYIERYKNVAVAEMVRSGIPASITLAQGILESSCGKSPLSREANNHFGIKCKEEWSGKKYYQDDDQPNECFRVYEHAEASYADHSDFLLTRPRYAPLFQLPKTDYKSWARGLKAVGYATNPHYAEKLIDFIETYQLTELDKISTARTEEKDTHLKLSETASPEPVKEEIKQVATEPLPVAGNIPAANEITGLNSTLGEFEVNGVRVIQSIGNQDPFKIAFDHNIDYTNIMIFNDLNTGDRFKDGEFIYLQAKKYYGAEASCTAKAGESMRDISQRFGIKLKELYQKNLMKPNDQVYEGEIINLQEKRSSPPRVMSYAEYLRSTSRYDNAAQTANTGSQKESPNNRIKNTEEYRVQQTDTLYSIAKKFNTTVEQLKKLNKLGNTELQAGQTLIVAN